MFIIVLAASLFVSAIPATIACYVDPTNNYPALTPTFNTVNLALSSTTCNSPGSTITIVCPIDGCHNVQPVQPFTISSLDGITITSGEVSEDLLLIDNFGPVRVSDELIGVHITDSTNIKISGMAQLSGERNGIWIENANATIIGRPSLGMYCEVAGGSEAVKIEGDCVVELFYILALESPKGIIVIDPVTPYSRTLTVTAAAIAIIYCELAIEVSARHAVVNILSDFTSVTGISDLSQHIVHNYITNNTEGILAYGNSVVTVEHTIFAGNLRRQTTSNTPPVLITALEYCRFDIKNCLIYDNDAIANPGEQVEWSTYSCPTCCDGSPCVASSGAIFKYDSLLHLDVVSCTIIDNQIDKIFDIVGTSENHEDLFLSHNIIAHNWGEVFSLDSWIPPNCPPFYLYIVGERDYLWDNKVDVDRCFHLFGFTTLDPKPRTMTPGYAAILVRANAPGPFGELYLIDSMEPNPGLGDSFWTDLYQDVDWTVDGAGADTVPVPLDAGYHNPIVSTTNKMCSDDPTWKSAVGGKNCGWVIKKPWARCKAKIQSTDGVRARVACPLACGTSHLVGCEVPTCDDSKKGWTVSIGGKHCSRWFKNFKQKKCVRLGYDVGSSDRMFAYESCSACGKCVES